MNVFKYVFPLNSLLTKIKI